MPQSAKVCQAHTGCPGTFWGQLLHYPKKHSYSAVHLTLFASATARDENPLMPEPQSASSLSFYVRDGWVKSSRVWHGEQGQSVDPGPESFLDRAPIPSVEVQEPEGGCLCGFLWQILPRGWELQLHPQREDSLSGKTANHRSQGGI